MKSISIDLGGTTIKIGIVENGVLLVNSIFPYHDSGGIGSTLSEASTSVKHLLAQNEIDTEMVAGIGISFPGIVDTIGNRVLSNYVKYPDASTFDFVQWGKDEWNLPVFVANDAKAALLGEFAMGAGVGFSDIVMLTVGTGVGSAVMMNSTVLDGRNFIAGNLAGHMSINFDGHNCNCGYYGCVESEASSWKLHERIASHPAYRSSYLAGYNRIEYFELFEAFKRGDELANLAVENCIAVWSTCCINMIHAFDPQIVILGGAVMKSAHQILHKIQLAVDKYSWLPPGDVKIICAHHPTTAALLGMDHLVSKLAPH